MRGQMMLRAEVLEIQRLAREEGLAALQIVPRSGRSVDSVRRALRTDASEFPVERPRTSVPAEAFAESKRLRVGRAKLRASMVAGDLTLEDVLGAEVHPLVAGMPLVEVVRMRRRCGRRARDAGLEQLGREALRDRVNLMMAAGRASAYSRAWVAEHGEKWVTRWPEPAS
jgi:hypothetical protein